MDFQPNNAHEFAMQDMEERLGWKPATDQRPASFSAGSQPHLIASMGFCFPQSLVSPSPLDPRLTAVECWKIATPGQWPQGVAVENGSLSYADLGFPREGNASQNCTPQGSRIQVPEADISPTNHQIPFEPLRKPTWPQASGQFFNQSSIPNESLHNHLVHSQIPVPWQVPTENVSPFEGFVPLMISTQPMMVPIPSASNSYTASRSQSHSSGMDYRSPSFEGNPFPVPDSSPEEEYEEVPRSVPGHRDLSNIFMFGSSGANSLTFNVQHMMPMDRSFVRSQHAPHGTHKEESDVTWTEMKATPTDFHHHGATDADAQMLSEPHSAGSNPNVGTLSRIHVHTPNSLPGPQETPPRMDELIVNFETSPSAPPAKGKRKAFGPVEREKVKKVRKSGACFSCRAKKYACTEAGVCNRCTRAMGQNPQLADHICLRKRFSDMYIGVKDIHASLWAREGQLNDILASLTGTPKQVEIWVGDGPNAPKLELQVMQCHSNAIWAKCRWKCLKKVNGIYITSHFVEDQRYAIVKSSLPSIEQLDHFGRKILWISPGTHSGNMTPLLDRFLLLYCKRDRRYHQRGLANQVLRIASLNGLVAYGFTDLYDGSYDLLSRPPSQNQRYVSETIHDQIRLKAAEGFESAEKHIFNELDNLREITGSDDHNRIVAGICLLRLILLYRERMVRDEIRLGLPRHGKRRTGHQARLEKAARMYKRLTVVYGTLCSGSDSPMGMDWHPEGNFGAGEEDHILETAFNMLKVAYEEFCDERLTQQHDDVFKQLIVEPAKKGNEKREKAKVGKRR